MVVYWIGVGMITGSNLDGYKVDFIFAEFSLEGMWKGRGSPSRRGGQEGLKNHLVIIIEYALNP